jgi:hypothetical protein
METHSSFLNAGGAGWTELVGVAVEFGVGYLTAKNLNEENKKLLQQMAELDAQSAENLKKALNASLTEVAKTQVIYEFLNAKKIKELEEDTKRKRILPLIGLGVGVVVLALIFYKLHRQNG